MVRTLYIIAMALLALATAITVDVFFPDRANAGSSPWGGCYIGGGAAYSDALTDTSLDVAGAGIAGTVGCDIPVAPRIIFGVYADYLHNPDTTFSVSAGVPSVGLLETSLDNAWSVGARGGYLVTSETMLYVLLGYAQAGVSDITSPAFPAFSLSVPDLKGYVVGGGIETALGRNLYAQFQGTFTNYDKESIDLGAPFSLGLDTDVLTVRAALLLKFNGPEQITAPFEGKPLK